MEPKVVRTADAPAAIGHYSAAYVYNGLVFTGGSIPLDPLTGDVVGTTMSEQTAMVMTYLEAVLKAAGSRLDLLLKTTCFISDIALFEEFNAAYAAAMGDHRPARSTVQVAALVRGIMVEVEGIAALAD